MLTSWAADAKGPVPEHRALFHPLTRTVSSSWCALLQRGLDLVRGQGVRQVRARGQGVVALGQDVVDGVDVRRVVRDRVLVGGPELRRIDALVGGEALGERERRLVAG